MELISCIIPTFNRSDLVVRAVKSVLSQKWSNWELIIVDDGSTDDTERALHRFLVPAVRYEKQDHAGVSAARNRGIDLAQGNWIAFLDSDDVWQPTKLTKQIEFLKRNPDYLICQSEEVWIRNGRRVNPMKKHRKFGGWIFDKCLPLCVISPSAIMMRRELFDTVGIFDESLPACEDYDLWLRIAAQYPIGLIPEMLLTKYGGHADQLSRTENHLDQYRIRALEKILRGGCLTQEQSDLALKELQRKCRIYGEGCLKRGREAEGQRILSLPQKF